MKYELLFSSDYGVNLESFLPKIENILHSDLNDIKIINIFGNKMEENYSHDGEFGIGAAPKKYEGVETISIVFETHSTAEKLFISSIAKLFENTTIGIDLYPY